MIVIVMYGVGQEVVNLVRRMETLLCLSHAAQLLDFLPTHLVTQSGPGREAQCLNILTPSFTMCLTPFPYYSIPSGLG